GANIIAIQVFTPVCAPELEDPCFTGAGSSSIILGLERVAELQEQFNIAAVNMSLGGAAFDNQFECDRVNAAEKAAIDNLRSRGVAVVIASGNEAQTAALAEPACISSAISVGATDDADNVAP